MEQEQEQQVTKTGVKDKTLYSTDTIAQLFGLSVRRINQLTQDGVIRTIKPPQGRRGYELVPTIQGYIKYLQLRVKGKASSEEEELLKKQKLQVDIDLKKSQLELHQLKTDIANGKYLSVETIQTDYQRFFNQFKKFAQAVPARLITQISGYVEPAEARALEKSMNLEVASMLRAFVVAADAAGASEDEKT